MRRAWQQQSMEGSERVGAVRRERLFFFYRDAGKCDIEQTDSRVYLSFILMLRSKDWRTLEE